MVSRHRSTVINRMPTQTHTHTLYLELAESDVIVVEGCQEQNVLARYNVVRGKASDLHRLDTRTHTQRERRREQ